MKVIGLFLVLGLATTMGLTYFKNRDHSGKSRPTSYKVMDQLEEQGIYPLDFHFSDLDGNDVAVAAYHGKIIIFSFWATWCEPCVEEFPSLVKLLDTFPDKIVLFAISHDSNKKDVINFIEAFEGNRPNIKVVFDKDKSVSQALEVDRLPEGYIFNSSGKLVKKILGIQDWSSDLALKYFEAL